MLNKPQQMLTHKAINLYFFIKNHAQICRVMKDTPDFIDVRKKHAR